MSRAPQSIWVPRPPALDYAWINGARYMRVEHAADQMLIAYEHGRQDAAIERMIAEAAE